MGGSNVRKPGVHRRWGLTVAASAFALLAATGTAQAAFGPSFQIGTFASMSEVAIDTDGDPVVGWASRWDGSDTDGSVRAWARPVHGVGDVGRARILSVDGEDILSLDVASDGSGGGVVTWHRSDGANTRVQARYISVDGVPGDLMNLSPAGVDASSPQVASDSEGDAFVVWNEVIDGTARARGRWVSASADKGPVRTLSPAGQNAGPPEVAVAPTGSTVVVWQRSDGSNERIEARRVRADSVIGGLVRLSAPDVDSSQPRVGIDADGDAVAIWRAFDGEFATVQTRRFFRNQDVAPTVDVFTNRHAAQPDIAVDADGDAIALWFSTPNRLADRVVYASDAVGDSVNSVEDVAPTEVRMGIDAAGNATIVMLLKEFTLRTRFPAAKQVSIASEGAVTAEQGLSGAQVSQTRVAVADNGPALATWREAGGFIRGSFGP